MDSPAKPCPHCHQDVSWALANGAEHCPACGNALSPKFLDGISRGGRWILFWVVFVLTPILAAAMAAGGGWLPVLILGTLFNGGILASLFAKKPVTFALWTVVLGIMLCVAYVGILFVGCLVLKG